MAGGISINFTGKSLSSSIVEDRFLNIAKQLEVLMPDRLVEEAKKFSWKTSSPIGITSKEIYDTESSRLPRGARMKLDYNQEKLNPAVGTDDENFRHTSPDEDNQPEDFMSIIQHGAGIMNRFGGLNNPARTPRDFWKEVDNDSTIGELINQVKNLV